MWNTISSKPQEGNVPSRSRVLLVFVSLLALFVFLTARLIKIQIVESKRYRQLARPYQLTNFYEQQRGDILDREGRPLAISINSASIYVIPKNIKNKEKVARILSKKLGIPYAKIKRKLRRKRFSWIKRLAPLEIGKELAKLKGVYYVVEKRRFYPKKELASNLLGFVGFDNAGLEGLERFYDSVLKGGVRVFQIVKDARGNPIVVREPEEVSSGYSLVLTIDEVVQAIVEEELERGVSEFNAKAGIAIVMDPHTGEILAMAVRPTFNPNIFARYSPSMWRNRAIADVYEPGSTLKPIVMAGLLEDGLIRDNRWVDCPGYVRIGDRAIHCDKAHGSVNWREVLVHSCNVGQVKLTRGINYSEIRKWLKKFGLGSITGIDLPGEARGIVPARAGLFLKCSICIGQGLAVTPVQLISAYAVIANGGRRVYPHVLYKIINDKGEVVKKVVPTVGERIVSQWVCKKITRALIEVVERGTARLAKIPGFKVAGKTGTAQKAGRRGYIPGAFTSFFIGYVPAFNPRFIALVMLDEPRPKYLASETSVPVFRRIATRILEYFGSRGTSPLVAGSPKVTWGVKIVPGRVPDFRGKTLREIMRASLKLKVKVEIIGTGICYYQEPPAGTPIKDVSVIKLYLKEQ